MNQIKINKVINMLSKNTKENIKNSGSFLVLANDDFFKEYLKNGDVKHQVDYAKSLKKPFRIVLGEGIIVPQKFKEDIKEVESKQIEYKKFISFKKDEMFSFLDIPIDSPTNS